jgi:hypothetical protein
MCEARGIAWARLANPGSLKRQCFANRKLNCGAARRHIFEALRSLSPREVSAYGGGRPSRNDSYLRIPSVPEPDSEGRPRAESTPTGVASARTGVLARYASPHSCDRRQTPACGRHAQGSLAPNRPQLEFLAQRRTLDPSAIELHDEDVSAHENRLIEPSPIQSRLTSCVTRSGRARPASRAMASW